MGFLDTLRSFFSTTNETPQISLPIYMKVRILDHGFRCGSGIDEDSQYISLVEPVEAEARKLYGSQFEVYSETIYRTYHRGDEVVLPFIDNPEYEPELLDIPPLVLYADPQAL